MFKETVLRGFQKHGYQTGVSYRNQNRLYSVDNFFILEDMEIETKTMFGDSKMQ